MNQKDETNEKEPEKEMICSYRSENSVYSIIQRHATRKCLIIMDISQNIGLFQPLMAAPSM